MILFLYGEDTFRSRQKLNELKEKFKKDVDPTGDSLSVLSGADLTVDELNKASSSVSLFSKRRMIVIDNLFENKSQAIFEAVLDYLKNKLSADNILVFRDEISGLKLPKYKDKLFKFLKNPKLQKNKEAKFFVQEFKLLSNTEVTNWTKKETEKRGGRITHQAAATLASLLGSDLWRISSEIDKLVNFKLGKKTVSLVDGGAPVQIETEDVQEMVRGNFDENIFALTDAIGANNKGLSVRLFEEQLEAGLNGTYLMTMIIRQFKLILQIKAALEEGMSQRKISTLLKMHPFVVQKGITQARNFSMIILKKILAHLLEIDKKIKTGKSDLKTEINLLLAKI